jgi:hypothetical protein
MFWVTQPFREIRSLLHKIQSKCPFFIGLTNTIQLVVPTRGRYFIRTILLSFVIISYWSLNWSYMKYLPYQRRWYHNMPIKIFLLVTCCLWLLVSPKVLRSLLKSARSSLRSTKAKENLPGFWKRGKVWSFCSIILVQFTWTVFTPAWQKIVDVVVTF